MNAFLSDLHRGRMLIGMVHVGALPGTTAAAESICALAQRAADDARIYANAGFDAVMIENMHDRPYLARTVGPEIIAGMTAAAVAVRRAVPLPLGMHILAGANRAALAAALAADFQFIRAEGFVFASVADEGLLGEADAGPLLRYRRSIGAEHIAVIADVRKKHASHAITADISLSEKLRAAAFFGADAAVVTGSSTGEAVADDDLSEAAATGALPVLVGSGATARTLPALFERAQGVIVGSACKRDGHWAQPVDPQRVRDLVRAKGG